MTQAKKTYKDLKDQKDLHEGWRANREGKRAEKARGGHHNLLREAKDELMEEAAWTEDEIADILEELDAAERSEAQQVR